MVNKEVSKYHSMYRIVSSVNKSYNAEEHSHEFKSDDSIPVKIAKGI